MLLTLAALIIVLWLLGFSVFHVASSAFHLILILAVAAIILHFVRRGGGSAV